MTYNVNFDIFSINNLYSRKEEQMEIILDTLKNKNKYDIAKEYIENYMKSNPQCSLGYYYYALFHENSNVELSKEYYSLALKTDILDPFLMNRLLYKYSRILIMLFDIKELKKVLKIVLQFYVCNGYIFNNNDYVLYGLCFDIISDTKNMLKFYKNVHDNNDNYYIGLISHNLHYEYAYEIINNCSPLSKSFYYYLGIFCDSIGLSKNSIRYLTSLEHYILDYDERFDIKMYILKNNIQLLNKDAAFHLLKQLKNFIHNEYQKFYYCLYYSYYKLLIEKNFKECNDCLQDALRYFNKFDMYSKHLLYPGVQLIYYYIGLNYQLNNNCLSIAIKYYQKVIKLKPLFAQSYFQISICFFKIGLFDKGLKYLNKSLKLNKWVNNNRYHYYDYIIHYMIRRCNIFMGWFSQLSIICIDFIIGKIDNEFHYLLKNY